MVMKHSGLVSAIAAVLLLSNGAMAADLKSWRFNPQQNQLDLTTEGEVYPTVQLIPNPTRLVIDLPGVRLGRPKVQQPLSGVIRTLRLGQFNALTTRLVIELAPGYTLDPQQIKVEGISPNRWTVQLPPPQPQTTPAIATPQAIAVPPPPADTFGGLVPAGRPLTWLQQRVMTLRGKYAQLQPVMFFLDLESGDYLNLRGDQVFPTASIIKLPILMAFFQDVDAGKIRLNETLVMRPELIVGGSGTLQDLPPWSKFSALETVTRMITVSDNTATNMIIRRMGGIGVLNQRFRNWGLQKTVMRNMLPDLRGTNTTTARELVRTLALLHSGKLLSAQSQTQVLDIMRRVRNRTLLPVGLGPGARIAHKTGDIGFMLGDAGIVEMPGGRNYLAAVMVKSAYNDLGARDYVQEVSRTVYGYFRQAFAISTQFPPLNPEP